MMMKLLCLLHRQPHSLTKTPLLQCRPLTAIASALQNPPQKMNYSPQFDQASANPCSFLIGSCEDIASLKKIHGLLVVHGLISDLLCQTKLVSSYGLFGYIGSARLMFDRIRNPDFYSWKVMIRMYFLNDLYVDIIRFYAQMRACVGDYDSVVSCIVLKACRELREIKEGRKVHCQVFKVGIPDDFVLTALVDVYTKCGELVCARQVFDEIVDGNVVSWTSMIAGYVQNDCSEEGLCLFNQMRKWMVEVNHYTFGSIVTACTKLGALHQGKWIHGYLIKSGVDLGCFLTTALLDMYAKCGDISDAWAVFGELSSTEVVSWTAMIVGYSHRGFSDEALKLFVDKKWANISPNSVTVASVLSACAQACYLKLAFSVHCLGIKLSLEDAAVKNALIHMYASFNMISDARYIFETVSSKNVVSWNSIIYGYSQNGLPYEALQLFHQMRLEPLLPDAFTLVSVLAACASLGAIQVGSSLHAYCIKDGILSYNVRIGTALLNFYFKCGDAKSSRLVFDAMEERNTITWSAMISGCGVHGASDESLTLFGNMLKGDCEPNDAVFTAVLSACSHTGMVGEGWKCFSSMCNEYKFVPKMKHYTCMVDLFSRSGRLDEALNFIENMPVSANASVIGAFLHGCKVYSRFDLGELAAKRMIALHPDEACYYVLLSNLYASEGKWNQANQVREILKQKGYNKTPGCSSVGTGADNGSSPGTYNSSPLVKVASMG